jgi:hypothetical protein
MSSVTTRMSVPFTWSMMARSVARPNTAPVGLDGLFTMTARVLGPKAALMASGLGSKPSSWRVWTMTGTPSASRTMSA